MKIKSIILLFIIMNVSLLNAQISPVINFQGVLTKNDGQSVEDGLYELIFSIKEANDYNSSDLWAENQTVLVTNGVYNVLLGSITSFLDPNGDSDYSDSLSFAKQYYLGLQVKKLGDESFDIIKFDGGYLRLTSSWSAFRSKTSSGRIISEINGDYSITDEDDIVLVSNSSTITLPTADTIPGRIFTIKNIDPNLQQVSIRTNSSETINDINCDPDQGGSAIILKNQFDEITVVSNGINWLKLENQNTGTTEIPEGSITTDKIADNSVTIEKIELSPNIFPYTSLNLTNLLTNQDISENAAISYTKINLTSMIKNEDIADNAAIAYTKLNLEGAFEGIAIADNSVTYTKLSNNSVASDTIIDNTIQNNDIADKAINAAKLNTTNIGVTGQVLVSDGEGGLYWNTLNSGGSDALSLASLSVSGSSNLYSVSTNNIYASIGQFEKLTTAEEIFFNDADAKNLTVNNLFIGKTKINAASQESDNSVLIPEKSGTFVISESGKVGTLELNDNSVDSIKIMDASIHNADIAENAAIQYTKLNLEFSIVGRDIASQTITYDKFNLADKEVPYTVLNLNNSITNNDIAESGINYTKLNLLGMINSDDIKDSTIISDDLTDDAVTPPKLCGIFDNGDIDDALLSDGGGGFYWGLATPFVKKIKGVKFTNDFGGIGADEGKMENPTGIAVDSENIYVVDRTNDRVQIFDKEGVFIRSIGKEGILDGKFKSPNGIAVDESGNFFVADTNNHRIQKFNNEGEHLLTIGGTESSEPGLFHSPFGVDVDRFGKIYVADSSNDRIKIFNSSGEYLNDFGVSGQNEGELDGPYDIAVDISGNIYVLEFNNNRVQIFNKNGDFITSFGSQVLANPYGFCVDKYANIYVSDAGNHDIYKFTNAGELESSLSIGGSGSQQGQFNGPHDVAVDSEGNVFVSDTSNNRVQIFNAELPVYTIETQSIGVGSSDPSKSAVLQLDSTVAGFLMPRMTQEQRENIQSPENGLMVYQTDNTTGFYYYDGSSWNNLVVKKQSNILNVGLNAQYSTINAALNAITDNSTNNRYLIKIGPGIYNEQVAMKEYVDLEGSGQGVTEIIYSGGALGPSISGDSPTILCANNAGIRFLTIKSISTSNYAVGVYNNGKTFYMNNVTIKAQDGITASIGFYNFANGSPDLENVEIDVSGTNSIGFSNSQSYPEINNIKITSTSIGIQHTGVLGNKLIIRNSKINADTNAASILSGEIAIGASYLKGSVLIQDGLATCAGVYDDSFTYYGNTCP